ncbi:hypothetical protein KZX46_02295 (plasmid) [Polymorphobacter sp. PAMC 29334]|uniref:hypothetical protein n=1 Tax=Polymorphobacter sp. PAMC 29334 TaxID=2862331 RepID=UPI001C75C67D|nr:hypothetical protein [Polymorphobacter sp. PAMC 29334]QYE32993.1 hypothetical protein KZX46_02295 [Polymorphobacter sp. PAMC 29334]
MIACAVFKLARTPVTIISSSPDAAEAVESVRPLVAPGASLTDVEGAVSVVLPVVWATAEVAAVATTTIAKVETDLMSRLSIIQNLPMAAPPFNRLARYYLDRS